MKLLKGFQAPHQVPEEAPVLAQLREHLAPATHQQLVSGGEEGLTDSTLRKWLVARKVCTVTISHLLRPHVLADQAFTLQWDVSRAAHDLQAHAKWRSEFVPHGRIHEVYCSRWSLILAAF